MRPHALFAFAIVWASVLLPAPGWGQTATAPPAEGTGNSGGWATAGVVGATILGDCRNCSHEQPYENAAGALFNGGIRVNPQMDAGAEVLWVPGTSNVTGERNRATFLLAVAQFRPWKGRGFFLKGGLGMGFARNWAYDPDGESDTSFVAKGLGVTYAAGWAFRRESRVGFQVAGSQHVVALGDIEAGGRVAENVTGNLWSIAAAVVIRSRP